MSSWIRYKISNYRTVALVIVIFATSTPWKCWAFTSIESPINPGPLSLPDPRWKFLIFATDSWYVVITLAAVVSAQSYAKCAYSQPEFILYRRSTASLPTTLNWAFLLFATQALPAVVLQFSRQMFTNYIPFILTRLLVPWSISGGYLPAFHCGGQVSDQDKIIWDLWWTKRLGFRFAPSTSISASNESFHHIHHLSSMASKIGQ
jgi:hypothetical protein